MAITIDGRTLAVPVIAAPLSSRWLAIEVDTHAEAVRLATWLTSD